MYTYSPPPSPCPGSHPQLDPASIKCIVMAKTIFVWNWTRLCTTIITTEKQTNYKMIFKQTNKYKSWTYWQGYDPPCPRVIFTPCRPGCSPSPRTWTSTNQSRGSHRATSPGRDTRRRLAPGIELETNLHKVSQGLLLVESANKTKAEWA